MYRPGSLSTPDFDLALRDARRLQAEHLRKLFQSGFASMSKRRSVDDLMRWVLLLTASVLCAIVLAPHGRNIELIMLAIALGSLVSSVAGFAFSALCGAILFHLSDDPVQVVQVMVTCSIANQAAMTWAARRKIVWPELSVYLAGGAAGLPLGVWLLFNANHTRYSQAFGILLLAYGAYMLLRKPMVARCQPAAVDFATGFLGGITGGAGGFPSVFVTIWCGMKGWDKARQRAVFQPFILFMQIATLALISFWRQAGAGGAGFDVLDLLFIPASLSGTLLGLSIYQRLSNTQFARAVTILLIISGLSYVV